MATLIELSVGWIQPCATSHSGPCRGASSGSSISTKWSRVIALVAATPGEVEMAIVAVAARSSEHVAPLDRRARRPTAAPGPVTMTPSDGRRHRETLVDEDLGAGGMIDDEQRDEIEEVRLPQLRRDAQVVGAVARHELIAAHLDPVFGHQHVGRLLRVDAQAERRSPEHVGDKRHLAAVPGKQPRARALQAAASPRWPQSPATSNSDCSVPFGQTMRTTSARVAVADADVDDGRRDQALLHVQPGAHLHFAADAERVDALIARSGGGMRAQRLPVVAACVPRLFAPQRGRPASSPTRSTRPSPSMSAAARTSMANGECERAKVRWPARAAHVGRAGAATTRSARAVVVEIAGQQAAPRQARSARAARARARPRALSSLAVPSSDCESGHDARRRARARARRSAASPLTSAAREAPRLGGTRRARGRSRNAPPRALSSDADACRRLQQRRVGHAIAIDVGPDEAAEPRHAARTAPAPQTCRRRCSADTRRAVRGAETTSRSPSSIDVGRPCAAVGAATAPPPAAWPRQ